MNNAELAPLLYNNELALHMSRDSPCPLESNNKQHFVCCVVLYCSPALLPNPTIANVPHCFLQRHTHPHSLSSPNPGQNPGLTLQRWAALSMIAASGHTAKRSLDTQVRRLRTWELNQSDGENGVQSHMNPKRICAFYDAFYKAQCPYINYL